MGREILLDKREIRVSTVPMARKNVERKYRPYYMRQDILLKD